MKFIYAMPALTLFGAVFLVVPQTAAFPPAPHQIVYGVVRDEQGNPLAASGAVVILEANGAVQARAGVALRPESGVNYELTIPLDSALADGLYKPSALQPTVPFRMRVRIGSTSYLPIEMTGARQFLTAFAASSRLDLTLGVDSDGDGLPDAWERALLAALGGGKSISDVGPGDDSDGDGLTNLQEYLAGTYAFDPEDGFALSIREAGPDGTVVEFTTIPGRTYTVRTSTDLKTWVTAVFRVMGDEGAGDELRAYPATDVRLLRVRVAPDRERGASRPQFLKLMVQ